MNMNNSVKAFILFACGFAAAAVTLPALSFSGSADKSSDKSSNKSSDKASSTVAPSSISTSTSTAPAPAPEAPAQKAQSTTTKYTLSQVAKTIDHALLKPEMAKEAVLKGCELAARYGVASVCCKPADVVLCVNTLEMHKSDVLVGTVVGFPHGASTTETKVFETSLAVKQGAVEIDMVINIGLLKGGQLKKLQEEIEAITLACNNKAIVKVILENAYLTDDEIITACEIVEKAGAAGKSKSESKIDVQGPFSLFCWHLM